MLRRTVLRPVRPGHRARRLSGNRAWATSEGRQPAETTVTVAKGREAKVLLKLAAVMSVVEVTGTPVGAAIRESVDGPEL